MTKNTGHRCGPRVSRRMARDRIGAALLWIVGLACVLLIQPVGLLGQELKNIRPQDAMSELLLRLGQERSQSFRELVASLEQSLIVVYVELRQDPRHSRSGRLRFLAAAGGMRWVSVTVDAGTSDVYRTQAAVFELTSILGHELQHAVEVSQATTPMKDVTDFERYFRGIGVPGSATLDTLAARQMGASVGDELRTMHTPRPTAVSPNTRTAHADELRTLMHQHLAGDL